MDIKFVNVLILGFGFMFVFTSFQTMGNIEVSKIFKEGKADLFAYTLLCPFNEDVMKIEFKYCKECIPFTFAHIIFSVHDLSLKLVQI